MNIEQQQYGEVTVLKPQGPVIGTGVDQLAGQIAKVLEGDCRAIVLDTSRVTFVDSRGLEALVDATEELIRHGQVLKLAGANETLKEVLELTELASLFEQFDDADAAVRGIE